MKVASWRWIVVVVVAVSMVGATATLAQQAPTQGAPGQVTPLAVGNFDGKVEPVDGTDDRTHLAYELRLTNITSANLTLERLRVLDPSRGGRVVDVLSGDELDSRIIVFGGSSSKQFGPGCLASCLRTSPTRAARGCPRSSITASTSRRARPRGWPRASGQGRRSSWARKTRCT
jgi:hypothetical protein